MEISDLLQVAAVCLVTGLGAGPSCQWRVLWRAGIRGGNIWWELLFKLTQWLCKSTLQNLSAA